MHHTLAWSVDAVTATDTDITPVTDGIIQIQNAHFVLPKPMYLDYMAVMATNITRAQLSSPTIRQFVSAMELAPLIAALTPPTNPNIIEWFDQPFMLRGQEEVQLNGTQTAGANQVISGVAHIREERTPEPSGDRYFLRATSTTAAVALSWTQIALTYQSQLPVGQYAVVGAKHGSATGKAFRLILDNQYLRPGGLSTTAAAFVTTRENDILRVKGMGEWGRFNTISLPRMEVFCTTTDNAHTVLLEVVRTAIGG